MKNTLKFCLSFCFFTFCFLLSSKGQVSINNIAYTDVCVENLNDIVISEKKVDDFKKSLIGNNNPQTLTYSIGFNNSNQFNFITSSLPTISYTLLNGNNGSDGSIMGNIQVTSTSVSFDYRMTAEAEIGKFTISGLQVINLNPSSNANIIRIGSGTSSNDETQTGNPIGGNNALIHATLDSRINLAISQYPVAGQNYGCVGMPLQFTATNLIGSGGRSNLTYKLVDGSGNPILVGGSLSNIINYKPTTSSANSKYYVQASFTQGTNTGCVLQSNTLNTDVEAAPSVIPVGYAPGTKYDFTVFDNPQVLNSYVPLPSDGSVGYDVSNGIPLYFTALNKSTSYLYVIDKSGQYFMSPSSVYTSASFDLVYKLIANTGTNKGCKISDTLKQYPFNVVNPNTPPPSFSPYTPIPICEKSTQVDGQVILSKLSWIDPGAYITSIRLSYNNANPYYLNPTDIYYQDNNATPRDIRFYFNPTRHINYRVDIQFDIANYDGQNNSTTYYDSYSIFPTRDVQVKGFPNGPLVYFPNNPPQVDTAKICSASKDVLTLTGSPSGGTYTFFECNNGQCTSPLYINDFGAPVDNNNPSIYSFRPYDLFTKVAKGDLTKVYKLTYDYPALRIGACPETRTVFIKFNSPTDLLYTTTSPIVKPYCYGDTLKFKLVNNIAKDSVYFDFGDGTNTIAFSPNSNYKHFYTNPGQYAIRFKTNRQGAVCNNDLLDTIQIGAKPSADFAVKNIYVDSTAKFKSLSTIPIKNNANVLSLGKDTIKTWSWFFGDGNKALNLTNTFTANQYMLYHPKPYLVRHAVKSGWGCTDTVNKYIPVFPVYKPDAKNSYTQDFNATDSTGWYQSGDYRMGGNASWKDEAPKGVLIKSPSKAWITDNGKIDTAYNFSEFSWVETPAFFLNKIPSPMVALDTWFLTENQLDGACFQWSFADTTFGNEKWHTIGLQNQGVNWYNSDIVVSMLSVVEKNGLFNPGWTGANGKSWTTSRFNIDSVKAVAGNRAVRFRILFVSNADNAPGIYDGFAFDNFFIGQRNRNVLIEEFCDYNHVESGFEASSFYKNPQLIRMQYHTRYMTLDDQINNQNIGETGARDLLYGISQLPRAAVDGYYSNDTQNPFFGNQGKQNYDKRLLDISPYTITINTPSVSGNQLNFSVNMTRDNVNGNEGPFVLQVAVLEDSVFANGKSFSNVFRKFLPHAAGEHVDKNNWLSGASNAKILNRNFTPFTKFTPRKKDTDTSLVLVAFIQDEATSVVYQSQAYYVPYAVVKNLSPVALPKRIDQSSTGITLYPNPTQTELSVSFDQGLATEDYTYHILNAYGQTILSGVIEKNTTIASITNIPSLTVGVYQFQLLGNSSSETKAFTIVR